MHELEQLLKRWMEFGLFTNDEEQQLKEILLSIELQIAPKTNYLEFIEQFNTITKKKYKPDIESRELFYENEMIHSLTDRIEAVKNAITDPWIKESSTILTPKWILKPENTAKYMNYTAPVKETDKSNKDLSNTNYAEISL